MKKIKAGIVGGTGYTGVELLRLLAKHPEVELQVITSRGEAGIHVADMFPNLRGVVDLSFTLPDPSALKQCDVVFFATPNGIAMEMARELLDDGVKVIDLAADFRIKDIKLWEKWYGMNHASPDLVGEAVYGLPELFRSRISQARLVANPGCYPTAVTLGILPLIEQKLISLENIVADCKSGVSGAGRKASLPMLYSEIEGSFKAYGVAGHRHLPEIRQNLSVVASDEVKLTFVPHLLPMVRGIHATIYARLIKDCNLQDLFEDRYKHEPFVDVLPMGSHPETRTVRGSNVCRISIFRPQGEDTVVILSVIDNLVKGAAGQAVQNMNIMIGQHEMAGLDIIATMP
jgi:N-acetyl-gamma-glutamyl-phosphate reductase